MTKPTMGSCIATPGLVSWRRYKLCCVVLVVVIVEKKDGYPQTVDLNRMAWLPDDLGQTVKVAKRTATSRPGAHGAFIFFMAPDGTPCYHKSSVEAHLGLRPKLTPESLVGSLWVSFFW